MWVATKNGKIQPLNRDPDPEGNIRLTSAFRATKRGVLQECAVIPRDVEPTLFGDPIVRYMPHHATCPFADEFPKPKVAS